MNPKERGIATGVAIVILIGFVHLASNLEDTNRECNTVLWKTRKGPIVYNSGYRSKPQLHLRAYHDEKGILQITWEKGETVKYVKLPTGELTFCLREKDTVILNRDGTQWTVPGYALLMSIKDDHEAISYFAGPIREEYKPYDKINVDVFQHGKRIATLDSSSPHGIREITPAYIHYIDYGSFGFTEGLYYFSDGSIEIVNQYIHPGYW